MRQVVVNPCLLTVPSERNLLLYSNMTQGAGANADGPPAEGELQNTR